MKTVKAKLGRQMQHYISEMHYMKDISCVAIEPLYGDERFVSILSMKSSDPKSPGVGFVVPLSIMDELCTSYLAERQADKRGATLIDEPEIAIPKLACACPHCGRTGDTMPVYSDGSERGMLCTACLTEFRVMYVLQEIIVMEKI